MNRDSKNENDMMIPTINKLTRRKSKETKEWSKWQAKFIQLDQYETQETFGPPCLLLPDTNVLNFFWAYVLKEHKKRFKARCVCNGSSNRRGTVTLDKTYANLL